MAQIHATVLKGICDNVILEVTLDQPSIHTQVTSRSTLNQHFCLYLVNS